VRILRTLGLPAFEPRVHGHAGEALESLSPEAAMPDSQGAKVPVLIALLRGINVGGNILKMDRLCEICTKLGAENPRTYVQSGNVVFKAAGSATEWEAQLEKKLAGESRLPVSVIVRTSPDIDKVVTGNPFLKEKGIESARLAVTFLKQPPAKPALAALGALEIGRERFHHRGRELYIHCPDGFADAKLYTLEKILGQRATTRNWRTVIKLCEMAGQDGP
jgi:uncharacterized protein (DUF1697 family)